MAETDLATLLQTTVILPAGTFTLTVIEGVDQGASLVVDGAQAGRVLVGTSPACHLVLRDRLVSRRHLALEIEGSKLRVVDTESSNGTRVGGRGAEVEILSARLGGGETIRIGETSLLVTYDAAGVNAEVPYETGFGRVIGESREMRRLYPLCKRLAATRVPVLIEGETGTGKEVLAEALHEEGPLAAGPYVVFDCTAVPSTLIESELFGHERGAFTGATNLRRGVFEQAHGGTLLIDEIGDLELPLQAKLLRAIERGEIRRVGGDRAIKVDVRILSATRRDLDREVQAGRFRDDLYHRLAVARIELPPLRSRLADVPALVRHFWRQSGGEGSPPPELLARFGTAAWPGNVRELRNAVARAIALGDAAHLSPLPKASVRPGGEQAGYLESALASPLGWTELRQRVLDELERRYVEKVLAAHGGNVTRAAAASGIARRHFQRILARTREEGHDPRSV